MVFDPPYAHGFCLLGFSALSSFIFFISFPLPSRSHAVLSLSKPTISLYLVFNLVFIIYCCIVEGFWLLRSTGKKSLLDVVNLNSSPFWLILWCPLPLIECLKKVRYLSVLHFISYIFLFQRSLFYIYIYMFLYLFPLGLITGSLCFIVCNWNSASFLKLLNIQYWSTSAEKFLRIILSSTLLWGTLC